MTNEQVLDALKASIIVSAIVTTMFIGMAAFIISAFTHPVLFIAFFVTMVLYSVVLFTQYIKEPTKVREILDKK